MKEMIPVISDDLDLAEKGIRTPAQQEASLGFMGRWFELDLTDDHMLELSSMLNRWIAAGRPTSKPQSNRLKPGKPVGSTMSFYARHRAWHLETYGTEVPKKLDGQGYRYNKARVAEFRKVEADRALGGDRPE